MQRRRRPISPSAILAAPQVVCSASFLSSINRLQGPRDGQPGDCPCKLSRVADDGLNSGGLWADESTEAGGKLSDRMGKRVSFVRR